MTALHFSSECQDWSTPQRFFDALHAEFGFTLDACATPESAKCGRYFTLRDNALWQKWDGVVWMNPPYGREITKWVRKAHESAQGGAVVVALVFAKTETGWWHDYVMRAAEVRLIRGRLRFSGSPINAPFGSAVVVWRPGHLGRPRFTVMDRILDTPPLLGGTHARP